MEKINEHDMTKRMLDRIRQSNKNTPMMNEGVQYTQTTTPQADELDEHDITKKMLGTIREGSQQQIQGGPIKQMIDERDINKQMRKVISEGVDTDNSNNSGNIIEVGDDDIAEAKEGLKDIVGSVDMKLYQVNRELENVIMIGVIKDAGGIEFKLDKVKAKCHISIPNPVELDSRILDILKKLQGYLGKWMMDWTDKMPDYLRGNSGVYDA